MADRDNRQHKRFKLPLKGLIGKLNDDQIIDIVDLSVGGIAIESDDGLDVGGEYSIRVEARNHILEVRGTVAWSRIEYTEEFSLSQRSPFYISALRFQKGSEDRVTDFICDALLISNSIYST